MKYYGAMVARVNETAENDKRKPIGAFVILELCDGSLDEVLDTCTDEQRIRWLQQLASAVLHMHDNLMTHTDLTNRHNVFLRDGDVKLGDFGSSNIYTDPEDPKFKIEKKDDVSAVLNMFFPRKHANPDSKWPDRSSNILRRLVEFTLPLECAPETAEPVDSAQWKFPTDGPDVEVQHAREALNKAISIAGVDESFKDILKAAVMATAANPDEPVRFLVGHAALADLLLLKIIKNCNVHVVAHETADDEALARLRKDVSGDCSVGKLVYKHSLVPMWFDLEDALHQNYLVKLPSSIKIDPKHIRSSLKSCLAQLLEELVFDGPQFGFTTKQLAELAFANFTMNELLSRVSALLQLHNINAECEIRHVLRAPGDDLKFLLMQGDHILCRGEYEHPTSTMPRSGFDDGEQMHEFRVHFCPTIERALEAELLLREVLLREVEKRVKSVTDHFHEPIDDEVFEKSVGAVYKYHCDQGGFPDHDTISVLVAMTLLKTNMIRLFRENGNVNPELEQQILKDLDSRQSQYCDRRARRDSRLRSALG
ncbi:MAG: hypothetical protein MHM6MM_008544 [Cercozoa sp. M6MM]